MIELRLLGPPLILRDGQHIPLQPKRLALLAYLVLADRRGIQRRDTLLGVFWPEYDASKARASLRQALLGIRQAVGANLLVTRGDEEVGVELSLLHIDAQEFEKGLLGTEKDVVGKYPGPLLHGFYLTGCPEFDHWLESERERLALLYADAVEDAANEAVAAGNLHQAVGHWRQMRLKDPYSARAIIGVMSTLAAMGDRAAAIAQFRHYADQLEKDLELTPEPDVVELVTQLTNDLGGKVALLDRVPTEAQLTPPGERKTTRYLWPSVLVGATMLLLGVTAWSGLLSPDHDVRPNHLAIFPARVVASANAVSFLETGLPIMLDRALDGAGDISTVDMNRLLPRVERANVGVPSIDEAAEFSRELRAPLFVLSYVTRLDTTLHITVRLYSVDGGDAPIAEADVTGAEAQLADLVDSLAMGVLSQHPAGEGFRLSETSAVRPANYPALKAYLQGVHAFRVATPLAAIEAFERAVSEDSTFGLAWYRKSVAEGWANHTAARESMRRAWLLSNELSERDSLFVESQYAMWWGDPDRADSLTDELIQHYPDHVESWHARGKYLQFFGWRHGFHPNEAEAAFRKALDLDAGHAPARWGLGVVLNKLRRPVEGYAVFERNRGWVGTGLGDGAPAIIRATLRPDRMGDSLLRRLSDLRPAEIEFAMRITASAQSFTGSEKLARSLTEPHRPAEFQALGHLHLAHLSAARGRWSAAAQHFTEASVMFPTSVLVYRALLTANPFLDRPKTELTAMRDSHLTSSATFDENVDLGVQVPPVLRPHVRVYLLGILEGRLGNDVAADAYADTLRQAAMSADSLDLLYDLAIELRALGALARRDTAGALAALEGARLTVRFDHWVSPFHKRWYGTFLRAELLYEESRDREALGWYSGFGPGNESLDYVYFPWSHYRRGQLFERVGEPDSAIAHYGVFLDEWGGADPEYRAIVREVTERRARLISEQVR